MIFIESILVFFGVLATAGIFMKWWNRNGASGKYRYPPSLPSIPLVGSLPFMQDFNDISVFFAKKAKELGPIFTLRVGSRLAVTLNSKDVIEKAVVRNSSVFSDRPEIFVEKLVNPHLKGFAAMTDAKKWKKRQILVLSILKEFGFGVKSIMESLIIREAEALIEFIKKKKGESFDPAEMCFLLSSNVIENFLFGHRREYHLGLSELTIQLHRYAVNGSLIFDIAPFLRFIPPFRQILKNVQFALKRIIEILGIETDKALQNSTNPSFVQSYVQKVGPDCDRELLSFILKDLAAGGTDTSAITIQWALIAMANYPDVQRRVHAEIEAILPGDQLPALQDQAKLPYVEATLLEIYRWRTLAPLSLPRSTSQDTIVDGYFIPRGTMVLLNLYAAHNDPNVWKEPNVFRPERFLDEENNVIWKDKVISFSLGRRSCPGEALARAEIFLIFTSLVKRFHILPPEGQDKISEDNKVPVPVTLLPLPFNIRLIARKF